MKRLILALTFGAFAAGSASAQLRLTLDDAIQMALSENPTIRWPISTWSATIT